MIGEVATPPGHGCELRGSSRLSDTLHSIWRAERENAPGWRDAGKSGPKAECLASIAQAWTDVRPLSLRRKLEEAARTAEGGRDGGEAA